MLNSKEFAATITAIDLNNAKRFYEGSPRAESVKTGGKATAASGRNRRY